MVGTIPKDAEINKRVGKSLNFKEANKFFKYRNAKNIGNIRGWFNKKCRELNKSYIAKVRKGSMIIYKIKEDQRLTGDTAEFLLCCLLKNRYGIDSQRFNIEGFDVIAFDTEHKVFLGNSPILIQVKCRGSNKNKFNPTGLNERDIKKIEKMACLLKISTEQIYLAIGFFNCGDIRSIKFYLVPLKKLNNLKEEEKTYRFRKEDLDRRKWVEKI